MQLFVRADRTLCLDVELSHTVWQLKEALQQRIGERGWPLVPTLRSPGCGAIRYSHNLLKCLAQGINQALIKFCFTSLRQVAGPEAFGSWRAHSAT